MSDDTECGFLAMITVNGSTYPTFVRAASSFEAIEKAVKKWDFLKMSHEYAAKTYVVDPDSLQDVIPDLKQLARFYWMQACPDDNVDANLEAFENAWSDHGVSLDERP